MKQSCYGCRALDGKWCNLGYKNRSIYNSKTKHYDIKPEENCRKPTTYEKWLKLREAKSSNG